MKSSRHTGRTAALLLLVSSAGCYDGITSSGYAPWSGTGGTASASEDGSQPLTSETSEGSNTSLELETSGLDDGTTGEALEHGPAQGVDIVRVVANQGVNVTLGEGGLVLAPREAVIVHGRRTLIQAHVRPGPTFIPHEVLGQLRLSYPDGTERVLESSLYVLVETDPLDLGTALNWVLEPADVVAGMRYDISLYELTLSAAPGEPPRFPPVGNDDLQVSGTEQTLEIVFVPYRHIYGGCDRTTPHDPARIEQFRKNIMQHLAVQDVHITVHAVETYTQATGDLRPFLDLVTALRAEDQPPSSTLYYGSIYPCDKATAGGRGWRDEPAIAASEAFAQYRVSVGTHVDFLPNFEFGTLVHELGHNLSRKHVACKGTEGTTDPAYPYPDGRIATIGWGIEDRELRPPELPEYMSYCSAPSWQSAYGWNLTKSILEQLELLPASAPPQGWILRIFETADGVVHTRILPGHVLGSYDVELQAVDIGGRSRPLRGRTEVLPEGGDPIYTFTLPTDLLPRLERVQWSLGTKARSISSDAITGLEQAREVHARRTQ